MTLVLTILTHKLYFDDMEKPMPQTDIIQTILKDSNYHLDLLTGIRA